MSDRRDSHGDQRHQRPPNFLPHKRTDSLSNDLGFRRASARVRTKGQDLDGKESACRHPLPPSSLPGFSHSPQQAARPSLTPAYGKIKSQ